MNAIGLTPMLVFKIIAWPPCVPHTVILKLGVRWPAYVFHSPPHLELHLKVRALYINFKSFRYIIETVVLHVFECFMTFSRPPFTIWRVHWPHCKRRRHPSNVEGTHHPSNVEGTHHRYCLVWYAMRIWSTCQCIGICLGLYLCLKALQSLELHKNINRQSVLDIGNGDQSINLCLV